MKTSVKQGSGWKPLSLLEYLPKQREPPDPGGGSVQFSSVAQSCPALCDPMDCSTQALPIHHQLPEFTQTHVH